MPEFENEVTGKRYKRVLVTVAAVIISLWSGSVSGVAAGNPDRQPFPTPPDVSGLFCGPAVGTVLAHVEVNRAHIKTFIAHGGTVRIEVNGFSEARITADGKTMTFNSGGPATITFGPNDTVTIVGRGHSFAINPFGPNTGILNFTGLITVDGNTGIVTSSTGHITDVCALFA